MPAKSYAASIQSVTQAFTANKSDSTDLTNGVCRVIMCSGSGVIRCILAGQTTTVDLDLTSNTMYPIAIKRVYNTGTTATGILVFY